MKLFHCDDVLNMDNDVGRKINRNCGFIFTHSVMLQSFSDDFSFPRWVPNTPVIPVNILMKAMEEDVDPPEETS